jgi:quinol monooxygenase YgiN
MIFVRIKLHVRPEKELEFTQTLLSIVEPARKEVGCISYSFYRNVEDNYCYYLLEEWKSKKDLNRHMVTTRFRVLLGLKSLLSKPLQIKIYRVSTNEGLELVEKVRSKQVVRSKIRAQKLL